MRRPETTRTRAPFAVLGAIGVLFCGCGGTLAGGAGGSAGGAREPSGAGGEAGENSGAGGAVGSGGASVAGSSGAAGSASTGGMSGLGGAPAGIAGAPGSGGSNGGVAGTHGDAGSGGSAAGSGGHGNGGNAGNAGNAGTLGGGDGGDGGNHGNAGNAGNGSTAGSAGGTGVAGRGGTGGGNNCTLPATVSFQKDVQPFLTATCGGGSGCHVIDASSTVSMGGYDHAYDWITAASHASSCPSTPTPKRFQVVIAVIDAANPASCSKARIMPPQNETGANLRKPLTVCQVATLQAWLDEPLVTQMHRVDDTDPTGTAPFPMPPFN